MYYEQLKFHTQIKIQHRDQAVNAQFIFRVIMFWRVHIITDPYTCTDDEKLQSGHCYTIAVKSNFHTLQTQ